MGIVYHPGIEKNAPKPTLYRIKSISDQVEQALRAYIVDQNLRVGGTLPAERSHRELFSVRRMTLRKALKRLSMEGIIASRPGVGHVVLSERPLRKYALLFGLDPLSPRSSSFHQKLAYWLRKHFTQEETEPTFLVFDREDRADAKLAETRRRLSVGEFAGAILIHWSKYIAPLEKEILASGLPFLSISTQSANPNALLLRQWDLVVEAYQWLSRHRRLPATAICTAPLPPKAELKRYPGLELVSYREVPDVYSLTQAALTSGSAPRAIIVPDDVAQTHAQAAILSVSPKRQPLLAHLAIKGDLYPAGVPRLLLEIDPQNVAAHCLEWLRDFPARRDLGAVSIRPTLRQQA